MATALTACEGWRDNREMPENKIPYTPTPVESAHLILKLYDQRREETLRKARNFMVGFDPRTFDEFLAEYLGPNSAYIRMVLSYWDMAASLVLNNAIDMQMFLDANSEQVLMFSRVQPFLAELREMMGSTTYLKNLEQLCMSMPDAQQRIDGIRERIRAIMAKRAANQALI